MDSLLAMSLLLVGGCCSVVILPATNSSIHLPYSSYSHKISIDTDNVRTTVNKMYLSFCIDAGVITGKPKWRTFDFKSRRMHTLMKGLSPAFLRFGGTSADYVSFSNEDPNKFDIGITPKMAVLNSTDWDNLVNLTRSTGIRLLFELNSQQRYGVQWDPTNTINLLGYLNMKGYGDNIDWELGNEPDEFYEHSGFLAFSGKRIAEDYGKLRRLLNKYPAFKNCTVVGPDTGSSTTNPSRLKLFTDFINHSKGYINAATFHQYYMNGAGRKAKDYINPSNFAKLEDYVGTIQQAMKKTKQPNLPLWIGETADANHGGTKGITDKYASSFLWTDKLGRAAKIGIKVVMRQTFYANNYPLIGDDLYPNPDYWISYIYKQLVDTKVLRVSDADSTLYWYLNSDQSQTAHKEVAFYSHCTKQTKEYPAGAVTVFGLTVNTTHAINLTFANDLGQQDVDVYLLTSLGPDGLTSRWIGLNGQNLTMPDDASLPKLIPQRQSASKGVLMPPLSIAFMVFPQAKAKACM